MLPSLALILDKKCRCPPRAKVPQHHQQVSAHSRAGTPQNSTKVTWVWYLAATGSAL